MYAVNKKLSHLETQKRKRGYTGYVDYRDCKFQ